MAIWPGCARVSALVVGGTGWGMAMTFNSCCGRKPRAITIDISGEGSLSLMVCDVCERQQWFREGRPVELAEVKVAAATRWNRQRNRG